MSDNPISPVDPIIRSSRPIGVYRRSATDLVETEGVVDAQTQRLWAETLSNELLKAGDQAVRSQSKNRIKKWQKMVKALWPWRRKDAEEGSSQEQPSQEQPEQEPKTSQQDSPPKPVASQGPSRPQGQRLERM